MDPGHPRPRGAARLGSGPHRPRPLGGRRRPRLPPRRPTRLGHRFTDPRPYSNPIPGNHGHPATLPIPFFVSGGSPLVRRGRVSDAPARTVDVAPTIAALYGLRAPSGGWDGTARTDAFDRAAG